MKKLKLFFACMLMAVLSIGQVWGLTNTYTKITSATSLDESAEYVIGDVDNYGCPTNTGGTSINTTEASWVHWNAKNVEGGFYLYNGAVYLKVPASNAWGNGTSSDCSVLTANSEGILSGNDGTNDRILVKNTSNAYLRWYKSGQTKAYLYKIEASSSTACATPTFSPEAGSYEGTQNVTITSTEGATIYYTTDGSTPTTSSSVYSSAIPVAADMTIKAFAVKSGLDDSDVATAAYEITEGPDVTLNLIDGNWGFPTSNATGTETYTNSVTGYSVTCYAPTNYKVSGSSYFYLGKSGAYIELPSFSSPIEKIVVTGNSGASTGVIWNIFKGDDAVSTAATGCAESSYTFNIDPEEANVTYTLKVTSAHNLQIKAIKIFFGTAPAVAKPTISGDENFVTSTTVTLSHADADHIYYTTNGDAPTTSSAEYATPFSLTNTATVKAIAVKGSDVSAVAEKTFTKVEALESMAALLEATTSTETAFNVVISNWVVTGVSGSRAWIADAANEKGILLYKSGHNFVAGNKLNGVVLGTKTKLYQGYPELTSLVSTDVTVTTAEAITPRTTTIAALTSGYNKEQGTVVKLENLTYTASTTSFSDGVNTLALNTQLYNPTMLDGAIYTIIGVVRYDNEAAISIMPRSVDDVEQTSAASLPEVTGLAALKAETTGSSYLVNLTDAVVTLVDGNNAFIEDATAGALIYFSGHGFAAGDKLNGQYEVTTATYQGKFEITAMEAQTGATKVAEAEIPVTTLTIAQLNADFAANESKRIKIVGVNVTDAIGSGDRNGQISDGANTFALYAGKNGVTAAENANIDVIGYPTFFNEAHQFNVWAQADITVNEKEDPELAYDPASETIEEGDAWSAPTLVNPHSLTIASYASNNEAVATVSGEGVIALAGGIGTAVITAHTDGDATYAAGNATYTITVNEAGVYSMSFDLTRASYDDAADAEVVWNSSVVTFTADKNDGTKVTNYLAGNYSGTTLIEETRFYTKNSLSFVPQEGVTITKVEWMSTAKGYATKLAAETWTNATAAVDATDDKLVIITPTAAGEFSVTLTDAARATGITVYYTAESEKAKLPASIAIADMNMAVGDEDILLSAIEATSNPNKKAISYAVTSGTAVTIEGTGAEAALHAAAEGSATITATIPNDLGNYTGASTTFNIVVAAAPATLASIAISGEASVLEYTAGQHFNPAGLVVTGTYSDASTAPITEGIDWTFAPDPLTEGTTSVSVTATVGEISSAAVVVNGLTVSAAPAPTSGNIVILAEYNSKFYAMTNSLTSGALAGVEVEKDGSKIVVSSAEDKAAIQWTATVDGDNTTLKDADDYYIKGSSGASLSLEADPYNWNWDGEKSCYISSAYTNRGLFFSNSGNVFKGYALSNITSDGYAATEVIEIDPEDIVISSKVDPELAYTPASDEITVGDAWSAPVLGYVEGFAGLAAITYESSNEAVATVTDAGVIALAGGTGTATITATFAGNASYLAGSATYTVKVNEPAEDCDGTDDFSTATNTSASSYNVARTTTNGWNSVNSALTTINSEARWLTMLGRTSQVGVITSPTLNDGIASLKIRYANTFNETNGVSFRVDIKQGEDIVKTYTITKENSEVEKGTVYTEIIENINVAGDFQMIFTNLCPSNADSNKDRVSIGRLCWSSYGAAPEPQYTDIRTGLTAGNYYTVCWPKAMTAIKGGSLWSFAGKDASMAYLILEEAPFEAGKPYIIYATDTKLEAVVEGDDAAAGSNNGLYGTLSYMDATALSNAGATYMLKNNELRPIGSNNHLDANRAYVILEEITGDAPAGLPKHRVRAMPLQGQTTTGIDALNASENPVKMMIDGQLFILRGEKLYDATGRLVK